jgi:plasmid stabilization system protein ParE
VKAVVYAPAALVRFADIFEYVIEKFGEAHADAYTAQLATRIEALATGTCPRARRCEFLMQGVRDPSGLTYYREGSHFLILREKSDTLEVVEILHGRMNLDEHLERLAAAGRPLRRCRAGARLFRDPRHPRAHHRGGSP